MAISLQTTIKSLAGIGTARAGILAKLGIYTLEDLLFHFPRAYQYRGNVKTLIAAIDGETSSFIVTIASAPTSSRVKNNITVTKFLAYDDTGKCTLTFFNQPYIKNSYKIGQTYRVYGKITKFGKKAEFTNPAMEAVTSTNRLLPLYPVYPATEGMSSKQILHLVQTVLEYVENNTENGIEEILPSETVKARALMPRHEAIRNIHFPESFEKLRDAKRRLIYEELFCFACEMYSHKTRIHKADAPSVFSCDMTDFKKALRFELTGAQRRTLNEIYADMTSKSRVPMRRLVCGDVGSGKTICAAGAAFIAAKSGFQTALLVPTEILSRQHYNELHVFFANMGINTVMLVADMPMAEKRASLNAVESGEADVIIGTHALLTDKVSFKNLGLVICDEQHRFGVNQREFLLSKGKGVHMLAMSATPIPRTLALVMFGDMDVSLIDELPPDRKPVSTYAVNESYRVRLNEFIQKEIQSGHQVYIVCPSVEPAQDEELPITALQSHEAIDEYRRTIAERKSAVPYAQYLQSEVFPQYAVGCIHGKMKASEKADIMRRFECREIDILVSTTVIEVGVNVPNATVMIIENAECFGLSQLHQLRGRVGRGSDKSYCVLVSPSTSQTASSRLDIMKDTHNGFKIAEQDLKMRGPGDFIKNESNVIRQHGKLKFSLASSLDDTELLYTAFNDAEKHFKATENII